MYVTTRPADHHDPEAQRSAATEAARELALAAHRATRGLPPGEATGLAAALRRAATETALHLEEEAASDARLNAALRALWRAGDLIDLAERLGWLDLDAAVELLALGSQVEIPLVTYLQHRKGTSRRTARSPAPALR